MCAFRLYFKDNLLDWKPNKWIASVLGLFIPPVGMLYVNRIKWAFIYFGIEILIILFVFNQLIRLDFPWGLALGALCAVHGYLIASHYTPIAHRPWYTHWYGLVSIPIAFFIGIFVIRAFMFEPFRMPAGSMLPSIEIGSFLVARKAGYGNYAAYGISLYKTEISAPVQRGDIFIFEYPKDPSIHYIKRVIGLPRDHIAYIGKQIYINGKPQPQTDVDVYTVPGPREQPIELQRKLERLGETEYFILVHPRAPNFAPGCIIMENNEVMVPKGQYFVLGDNRDNSNDSRCFGFVPAKNIVGKIIYVFH